MCSQKGGVLQSGPLAEGGVLPWCYDTSEDKLTRAHLGREVCAKREKRSQSLASNAKFSHCESV